MEFGKECQENFIRSETMLDKMEEHKQNMARTLQEIDGLEAELDQVNIEFS